jgi:hypothetical protein
MSVAPRECMIDLIHRILPDVTPFHTGPHRRLVKQFGGGMRARRRRLAKPQAVRVRTARLHEWASDLETFRATGNPGL